MKEGLNEKRVLERVAKLVELGFMPVEINLPESGWLLIKETQGGTIDPSVWMRKIPEVGDHVIFEINDHAYIGVVQKRAFEAVSAQQLFSATDDPHALCARAVLYLVDLQVSSKIGDADIFVGGDDAT